MLISQDIKNLIYEFADISAHLADAINPSGLGKAASVAKKVAGAAQESDTAKSTKKILDTMDTARHASGPKTAGNMSPEEFNQMLNQRKAAGAAKAVHKAVTSTDHSKPHIVTPKIASIRHDNQISPKINVANKITKVNHPAKDIGLMTTGKSAKDMGLMTTGNTSQHTASPKESFIRRLMKGSANKPTKSSSGISGYSNTSGFVRGVKPSEQNSW